MMEFNSKSDFKKVIELEDHYKLQYKVKFGKVPGTTFADRTQMGELLKHRSEDEVKMLIDHYLKMTDSFFKKNRHSLEIFFRNFNKVVMDVDSVKKARAPRELKLISTLGFCKNVKCRNRFEVTVSPSFEGLDSQYCITCSNNNSSCY